MRAAVRVRLSNQGYRAEESAARLGMGERTARTWINRFTHLGLPGLAGGPRSGRPPVYAPLDVGVVIETALTPPSELNLPFGSWMVDRLVVYLSEVKEIAIKRSRISEVLRQEGLRWRHQEGWFGERVDPDFAVKRGRSKPSPPLPLSTVS